MGISEQLGRGVYSHKRIEGGKLQVEKVRSAPEIVVARTQKKNMQAGKEEKRKLAGWSTKMKGHSTSSWELSNTKEREIWRKVCK